MAAPCYARVAASFPCVHLSIGTETPIEEGAREAVGHHIEFKSFRIPRIRPFSPGDAANQRGSRQIEDAHSRHMGRDGGHIKHRLLLMQPRLDISE